MLIVFFKQKTAYVVLRSLVGSEMCIRDRAYRRLIFHDVAVLQSPASGNTPVPSTMTGACIKGPAPHSAISRGCMPHPAMKPRA